MQMISKYLKYAFIHLYLNKLKQHFKSANLNSQHFLFISIGNFFQVHILHI